MKPQRRVVIYVRISRDREDETSTRTQQEAAEAYCRAHGWTVVQVVVEPGRSAFKANRSARPGFQRAMSMVSAGAADTFVVWKLDRAARNTLDLLTFVRELESHDAEFVSVTESFDTTTAMGRAMLTIVAALAELESAQKSDRAIAWHEHRRHVGATPNGPAALGYTKPAPNELVIDPRVGPLVREAADRIVRGESILATTKWINAQGVDVTNIGLRTALMSPTLVGLVTVERLDKRNGVRFPPADATFVEGEWEPLLNRETWDQLRVILGDPKRRTNTTNKLRHPLIPILRCHCGGRMRVTKARPDRYQVTRYQCYDCLNGISKEPVDEAVTETVLSYLDDSTWRKLLSGGSTTGPDPVVIEQRLAKMWDMVLAGAIEADEYAEAKALWRGELAAATRSVKLPNVDSVRASWGGFDPQQRSLVFRHAITSLVIKPSTRRGRGTDLTRVDLHLIA